MDSVDIDERIHAQQANRQRIEAVMRESTARQRYAQNQARHYEALFLTHAVRRMLLEPKFRT